MGGEEQLKKRQSKPLFPDSYIAGKQGSGVVRKKSYKALYIGIPVILFLLLFFIFKSKIIDAANDLITII